MNREAETFRQATRCGLRTQLNSDGDDRVLLPTAGGGGYRHMLWQFRLGMLFFAAFAVIFWRPSFHPAAYAGVFFHGHERHGGADKMFARTRCAGTQRGSRVIG